MEGTMEVGPIFTRLSLRLVYRLWTSVAKFRRVPFHPKSIRTFNPIPKQVSALIAISASLSDESYAR